VAEFRQHPRGPNPHAPWRAMLAEGRLLCARDGASLPILLWSVGLMRRKGRAV
jgi:hypothetical protein